MMKDLTDKARKLGSLHRLVGKGVAKDAVDEVAATRPRTALTITLVPGSADEAESAGEEPDMDIMKRLGPSRIVQLKRLGILGDKKKFRETREPDPELEDEASEGMEMLLGPGANKRDGMKGLKRRYLERLMNPGPEDEKK